MEKEKIKIIIDGQEVDAFKGETIMQVANRIKKEIPYFCYHPKLSIAANCRMCMVEVEGIKKPITSCSYPVNDGMVVNTKNEMVKEAREDSLEFLLANHPLDCPICDQGGECDLQDLSFKYGKADSKFDESKRVVEDKEFGTLVKTCMTRCIHCSRCVRFMDEIAGTHELALHQRGNAAEITSNGPLQSEISGNIIDICPVGALTSKPNEYYGRSWELTSTESIDALDALCSNIIAQHKNNKIIRIIPKENENVNEEWISNKARYSFDALKYQRITKPYKKINGKLVEISFKDAALELAGILKNKGEKLHSIIGPFVDLESLHLLKNLKEKFGFSTSASVQFKEAANTTVTEMEEADFVVIIGCNLRKEAPLVNVRIKKAVDQNNLKAFVLGKDWDVNFSYKYLGDSLACFKEAEVCLADLLSKAKKPLMILGADLLKREDALGVLSYLKKFAQKHGVIKNDWNGFNLIHQYASSMGSQYFDLNGKADLDKEIIYSIGKKFHKNNENQYFIYQGTHPYEGLDADLIIPSSAYLEKSGSYINLNGFVQVSNKVIDAKDGVFSDYKILSCLLNYLSLSSDDMLLDFPDLKNNRIDLSGFQSEIKADSKVDFDKKIEDSSFFYLDNIFSKNSPVMAKAEAEIKTTKKAEVNND